MNKTNSVLHKSLNALFDKHTTDYKNFFLDLTKLGVTVFCTFDSWKKPTAADFKLFDDNADRYIKSLTTIEYHKYVDKSDITDILKYSKNYTFVTANELEKFKTVTYPKLYAEWLAKQKHEKTNKLKNPDTIRKKIVRLQKQLNEIEG